MSAEPSASLVRGEKQENMRASMLPRGVLGEAAADSPGTGLQGGLRAKS